MAKERAPGKKGDAKAGGKKAQAGAGKSAGQKLAEKLFFTPKNCWADIDKKTEKEIEDFSRSYKEFLDRGKTERECVEAALALLRKRGFIDTESPGDAKLQPGARVYQNIRGKSLICAVLGKRPLAEGVNILGAHIDSPRIDLKQNPLYEDSDLALLDTHYYGGIKKYQWTAIPLAMHGLIITGEGRRTELRLGEEEGDPVFTITDLLPHLAREQMQKKAADAVEGEDLDVLAGSRPYGDEKVKERVKLQILALLHEKYGVTEEDFARSEIEFVPAFKARDLGFDRSMIGAYGHDDRCCAFPALRALLAAAEGAALKSGAPFAPQKTMICYLSDKEEIGSCGNTGAQSRSFENFIASLCGEASLARRCLSNSAMLSADVSAAYDPAYGGVFDKKNASFMGKGLVLTKYTGSGGKYGASDANAEFCSAVQAIMNRNKVKWQFGELGKVDKGGGGTIAHHAAKLGLEVLDCGIPVLSMHSPFEVISKIDLYTAYRGYIAFLREA
ncbi:MAG: aminopeptidase [Treponema sp.]|jgi:aspartyl aminopeptidase|nr:aminopeptidase [Treponema sp.]